MNNYLTLLFSNPTGIYSMLALSPTQVNQQWVPQIQCIVLTTVANCLTYSAVNNTCTVCAPGYFLNGNFCQINPYSIIKFCSTYNSLTTCSGCTQGYYLSTATLCLPVNTLNNCMTYDGTSSTSTCLACVTGYYVNNNVCTVRVNSPNIINCLTYTPNADTCQTCAQNYQMTTDNRGCLAIIQNCNLYTASSFQSTTLSCSACAAGYYLGSGVNTNTCVPGSVQFC
jgi:hypothetical protein